MSSKWASFLEGMISIFDLSGTYMLESERRERRENIPAKSIEDDIAVIDLDISQIEKDFIWPKGENNA